MAVGDFSSATNQSGRVTRIQIVGQDLETKQILLIIDYGDEDLVN